MGSRQTWPQIRKSEKYKGRWVALDNCRYDGRTGQPVEGSVIDSDEDLVVLCTRMQAGDNKHCAILFCDGVGEPDGPQAPAHTPSPIPPRLTHH